VNPTVLRRWVLISGSLNCTVTMPSYATIFAWSRDNFSAENGDRRTRTSMLGNNARKVAI
jgi:hypothetical protein